ncbi:MAG: hypothetical protein ACLUKN_02060 [Bacilli bacterium]
MSNLNTANTAAFRLHEKRAPTGINIYFESKMAVLMRKNTCAVVIIMLHPVKSPTFARLNSGYAIRAVHCPKAIPFWDVLPCKTYPKVAPPSTPIKLETGSYEDRLATRRSRRGKLS